VELGVTDVTVDVTEATPAEVVIVTVAVHRLVETTVTATAWTAFPDFLALEVRCRPKCMKGKPNWKRDASKEHFVSSCTQKRHSVLNILHE
jgi:hypothetical protein